jgi:hypothetical protein
VKTKEQISANALPALKRENERLQKLNPQRADDIAFLMQQLLSERGSKLL